MGVSHANWYPPSRRTLEVMHRSTSLQMLGSTGRKKVNTAELCMSVCGDDAIITRANTTRESV